MNYGYIRVSTDKQTIENQRFEITHFCENQGIAVDGWIEETISGTRQVAERKLGRLLKRVKGGDMIVCSELSRLGRNLFMIMEILQICMKKDCRVWTVKDGYRLGEDIQSKVLAFAFGLSAEIERNLISQRTKEALSRIKADGRRLGRPIGAQNRSYRLDKRKDYIENRLRQGVPKCEIARKCGVSVKTLNRWIERLGKKAAPFYYIKDNETLDQADKLRPQSAH